MQMPMAHTQFFANWTEFKLRESFVDQYKTREVPWGFGDLSYITYKRSYARPLDLANPHGPTEEWWQTCRRVIEGVFSTYITHDRFHGIDPGSLLPEFFEAPERTAEEMFDRMFNMKWLPPGRGLFAMGTSAMREKGAGCLNNCMFVSTKKDIPAAMRRLMDFSMLGVGVGFDTQGEGREVYLPEVDGSLAPYIVEDTREGWCDVVYYILRRVFNGGALTSGFKFGAIRPKGAPLRTFGGTASGPEPLIALVTWLLRHFGCRVNRVGLNLLVTPRKQAEASPLTELDILDIGAQIGHCVVMGGIRRTALICLGKADGQIPTAKNDIGDKLWRYRSNNSAKVRVGDDYKALAAETQKFGEPGYFWLELARSHGRLMDPPDYEDAQAEGTNPCVEQTLWDNELCCLVETFPARCVDAADFQRTLMFAYLYAKAVTLLPTHDPVVNEVIENNRRMGVSLAGVVQALEKFGAEPFFDMLDKGYQFLKQYDLEHSLQIGVKPSRKLTSVKPGGTVPLLAGATPGMHWDHAPFYIRRERFSDDSPYLKDLAEAGYELERCEDDPSSVAVSFLIKSGESTHKPDVSAGAQLLLAAKLQEVWADNQVSVTVHFRPEESVLGCLLDFDGKLKGVAFLPFFDDTAGDMPYKQLPYETISSETYARMYEKVTPLANRGVHGGHEKTDAYCDSDRCVMPG